jgi:hypothetical protein
VKHRPHPARPLSSPFPSPLVSLTALLAAVGPALLSGACAKVSEQNPNGTGGAGGLITGQGGRRVEPPPVTPCTNNVCTDLPATPIETDPESNPAVPANPSGMFSGEVPADNSLCITEPEDDTLFPNNWLRPRVKFANPQRKLTQIRLSAPNQQNVLVAYTMNDYWKVPVEVWAGMRGHQTNDDVTVTVWIQGGQVGRVKFRTAPVSAGGKMVFWAAKPSEVGKDLAQLNPKFNTLGDTRLDSDSELRGFAVGDESTISVLKISQVKQMSRDNDGNMAPVRCIGCHVATPDGGHVAFNEGWPWRMATASVDGATVGNKHGSQSVGGDQDLIQNGLGISTMALANWPDASGRYILVTSYGKPCAPETMYNDCHFSDMATKNTQPRLAWFDLASPPAPWQDQSMRNALLVTGTNMGFISRMGDSRGAASPAFSRDGQWIVYSSTSGALDGRLERGATDLYKVPYMGGAGGTAMPLGGGALANREEFYAAFSPDDKLIAFTSVPAGEKMYANPNAEMFVTPADGSKTQPIRLNANVPPQCSGKVSPGINNHWPRWSPEARPAAGGKTYYWLIFSSNRADIPPGMAACSPTPCYNGYVKAPIPISQLYMTGIIVGETGIESTTPAIYLWNQPTDTINTTPAWENFKIPMVM